MKKEEHPKHDNAAHANAQKAPNAHEENIQRVLPIEAIEAHEHYKALRDKYTRVLADYDNTRKRWDREREELFKYAGSAMLKDLLVTADELEQALKIATTHAQDQELLKGIEMTYNNFISILKKNGVTPIETKNKKFDPHLHEIVATRELEGIEDHSILDQVQKGFMLEDKVLRASKVIVGIKKCESAQEQSSQEKIKEEEKK
jgi:molecular chaperone GrpE